MPFQTQPLQKEEIDQLLSASASEIVHELMEAIRDLPVYPAEGCGVKIQMPSGTTEAQAKNIKAQDLPKASKALGMGKEKDQAGKRRSPLKSAVVVDDGTVWLHVVRVRE